MIRISVSKLLVVAPAISGIPIPFNKQAILIASTDRIFPAIHELRPDGILLDYDYLVTNTESILRRLRSNPFYSKIKIYCYKAKPNTKADGLLKALGVHYFIYSEDINQLKQKNSPFKTLSTILETRLAHTLVEAGV
jgi:hypothetical protein